MSTPESPRSRLEKAAAGTDPLPDANAELRHEARSATLDYLSTKWTVEPGTCPIDGSNDWFVDDVAMVQIRSGGSGSSLLARGYPYVPVVCKTCGYTFFINEHWVREGGPPGYITEALGKDEG